MENNQITFKEETPEVIVQIKDPRNGILPNLEISSKNPSQVYCMIYPFDGEIDICFYKNVTSDQILNIKRGINTQK